MTEDASEEEDGATCVPLQPGSAVLWHGRTCHYSRGNTTDQVRLVMHRLRVFACVGLLLCMCGLNHLAEAFRAWDGIRIGETDLHHQLSSRKHGDDSPSTLMRAQMPAYRTLPHVPHLHCHVIIIGEFTIAMSTLPASCI